MRNRYHRMSARELSRALDRLNLTAGQFARLAGFQRKRVLAWLDATEDIPHGARVHCATWLALPEAMLIALHVTDAAIVEEEAMPSDTS